MYPLRRQVCRDAAGSAVRDMKLHGARFAVQLLCTATGRAQQASTLPS